MKKERILIYINLILIISIIVALKIDIKSNEAEAQACAEIYQPGMMCGLYWMSQGNVQIDVRCKDHPYAVNVSCPSGYSQENFGYIETNGGPREFKTCFKI